MTETKKTPRKTTPTLARLFAKARVGSPTECWPWIAQLREGAYPDVGLTREERERFQHRSKSMVVSRYLLTTLRGRLGRGVVAMHTCDDPRCVNPNHIVAGSPAENAQDASRKGRLRDVPRRTRWTRDQVLDIRSRYLSGESVREIAESIGAQPRHVRAAARARSYRHVECVL